MSELHKFIFEGLPVRGSLVRLTDAWREVLRRRAANTQTGAYAEPVAQCLGEMAAAAVLMHASIQLDGTLALQVRGDGAIKVAVAEVQADLGLRVTASPVVAVPADTTLPQLINAHGNGRCAITLEQRSGQTYQGVVALAGEDGQPLASVAQLIEHYMRQSEQLETVLVLAADQQVAAGLMLQRLPETAAHAAGGGAAAVPVDVDGFNRLAILARSVRREELLRLDAESILHRLFWNEQLLHFERDADAPEPHFACSCSRERVAGMLRQIGREEVEDILREQGRVEVGCEFCGRQELFDAVDVAQLFTPPAHSHAQAHPVQ